ncbi:MAG: LamG domain-containing protein [Saprospiraceae bacterium]|nr:LamG domain-containing protein [Saprospiraceae bacterium]
MKNSTPYIRLFVWAIGLLWSIPGAAQTCENMALDFDGTGDFIELDLTTTPVSGNADFTLEAAFFANPAVPINSFQILFSLEGVSNTSIFNIGLLPGGQLAVYWDNAVLGGPGLPIFITTNPTDLTGACHHLAIAWQNSTNTMHVYVDGLLAATLPNIGPFNFENLLVGHSNLNTVSQDWFGTVDEIRLWSSLLNATQIADAKDCSIGGSTSNLVFNWTLNQPGIIAGGNNPPIPGTKAEDMTVNGFDGILMGFLLTGPTSNFVCPPCQPRYEFYISDLPSQFPVLFAAICSGDPVHFCISENFTPVGSIPGATVTWQYDDNQAGLWPNVTDPVFSGYCFFVPKGVIDISTECADPLNTTGYMDRKYRAKIEKSVPPLTCTYYTTEQNLRICCPVTGTVTLTPQPPQTPGTTTLCEGTVTVDVALSGPAWLPNVPIQWCINGVYDMTYDNMTSFTYTGLAAVPDLCFEAKIANCACPPVSIKSCMPVDPLPQCGTIDVTSSDIMLHPDGIPGHYLICPGTPATVGITNPFTDCTPVWQYRYDISSPWVDLGSTNPNQNTNTLPQTSPQNPPGSPYNWPSGATGIFYRIECRPKSHPTSGCPPCYSNEVQIFLKQMPPAPVISANDHLLCDNEVIPVVITNYDINLTYDWYCNGLFFSSSSGSQINATQTACYVVSFNDGCFTKTSNTECFTLCDPVAIIKCPEDNPCACYNLPFTLDGSMSYSNCAPIVQWDWTVKDGTTVLATFSGPTMQYQFDPFAVPPVTSATFCLTVTDFNGCTEEAKPLFIKACEDR